MVSTWLLVLIVIIAVFVIAIGIGWNIRNNQTKNQPPPINQGYTHPLVWTPGEAGPDENKNTCQVYQFPTTVQDGIAFVGAPTFNYNTLQGMSGMTLTNEITCIDVDQIIAQQMQHTCTGPAGVLDNSLVRCITLNGKYAGAGDTETFYNNTSCLSIGQCAGELSLVSLNYHGVSSGMTTMMCISQDYPGLPEGTVVMQECDPSNKGQLFRVTRINPGQNPDSLQPGSQSGMLAQILDRDTGLCLMPGTETWSANFLPTFVEGINSSCTGGPVGYTGLNITLSECTGGPYPGYVWALFPSIQYCAVDQGCSGCTVGYTRNPYSNLCCENTNPDNCPASAGFEAIPTPQQIFYIGNVDYNDIPITGTSNELFSWIITNNLYRLYFGGEIPSGVNYGVLAAVPIITWTTSGIDASQCDGLSSTSNYLNLTLYNTLIQQEPCLVNEISEYYCFF